MAQVYLGREGRINIRPPVSWILAFPLYWNVYSVADMECPLHKVHDEFLPTEMGGQAGLSAPSPGLLRRRAFYIHWRDLDLSGERVFWFLNGISDQHCILGRHTVGTENADWSSGGCVLALAICVHRGGRWPDRPESGNYSGLTVVACHDGVLGDV